MKPIRIVAIVVAIAAMFAVQLRRERAPTPAAQDLVVHDVTIRDVDGREAWRGDVDLAPTLERATSGARDAHRNDGGVFANRERLLPAQRRGYYHEYVVRTPGIDHAGPQRLVLGEGGEVFYSHDHYASFRRIR
ncbi:MAG: ribonuclease domain-containing protein [Longimicrobiales bacterium]